jgi:hypothetical protein
MNDSFIMLIIIYLVMKLQSFDIKNALKKPNILNFQNLLNELFKKVLNESFIHAKVQW